MKKKKTSSKKRKLKSGALKDRLLSHFKMNPKKQFTAIQLKRKLKLMNSIEAIQLAVGELHKRNKVSISREGKIKLSDNLKHKSTKSGNKSYENLEGIVDMTRTGAAFIMIENLDRDIFVNPSHINGALNGDTVIVRARTTSGKGKRTGKIIKIVKRAQSKFIGTLRKNKSRAYVEVAHKGVEFMVDVSGEKLGDIKNGNKVKVTIVPQDKDTQYYKGTEVESLEYSSTNDVAMMEILYNNGFAQEFPPAIEKEAEKLKMILDDEELARRRDFRGILTMTIDPATAKDFDDAISYEKLEDGHFEIGVHIADVTHFLRPGTALDREAFERSTSVYLVDRVAPMLPEMLSNDLCSLNPNEDKFCFTASFTFDKDFNITKEWFGKTVIHSDRRFTYEEAQERIESGEGDYAEEIQFLNKVATHLRDNRFKDGGISFETEELRFLLDEHGKPTDVFVKERKEAHMMIEDFMLLANRKVAKFIHDKAKGQEIPFIYRIHDEPDPERLAEFGAFAAEMGLKMKFDTPKQVAESFNRLAKEAEEHDGLKILEPLAIRTMAKAVYSTDNIGHYGLGFEFYAHFTSPIRRYADVMVHRVLFENLKQVKRYDKTAMEAQALHISAQERKAVDAERESIKYKQVEWAQDHIGESFEAYVSGIIERGVFVTIKNSLVEGMVEFSRIKNKYLVESRLKAINKRDGSEIKIGDTLQVVINSADLDKRQIDLSIAIDSVSEEE